MNVLLALDIRLIAKPVTGSVEIGLSKSAPAGAGRKATKK